MHRTTQKLARIKARALIFLLIQFVVLDSSRQLCIYAQSSAPAAPAATQQAPDQDPGWPRQVSKEGATLVYYQPQIDEWKDDKELFFRVAFSLTPAGGETVMGVANVQANTLVDKDAHTAFLRDITVTSVRFPELDADTSAKMEQLLKKLVPSGGEPISTDRLMADLEKNKAPAKPVAVDNDPPQIFVSEKPAILLMVQGGEPITAPIEKTDLKFVVNTNWDLFFDKDKKTYYLLDQHGWLTAKDVKGPWQPTQKLPKDMSKLPKNENWADVQKMVPPPPPSGAVPHVFFSDKPAELILFNGSPVYTKIPKTQLLYVANTENNVFLDDTQKQYYVLLSGRWFRTASLNGQWTYAGNDLPKDFAKIPPDSPKAAVLSSVPGTIQAQDAVLLAQIPQTAVVNKKEAAAKAKVTYAGGTPDFKPIEGTNLKYAANSQEQVIKVGDLYYLCFQGVWFKSTAPNGPWETADSVPKEIYNIPPSSPVYNVTYVTQKESSDDTVECSQTAGYLGMFVIGMTAGMVIGWGTGYYYPPYWGGGYAYYRPWPATYGAGAVYSPYRGAYGVGRAAYGPYGAVGSSAFYNPRTGTYGHARSAQGWYGGRTTATGYNPWTGARGATRQGHNAYAQWGSSAAVRGNQWAQTGHVSTARGTAAGYRSSSGAGVGYRGANGSVARTSNGVYAGNDGNVYRRNSNGNWSQYNNGNGSWNNVSPERQQQAQQRAQDARNQATPEQKQQAQQRAQTARDQGAQLPQSDRPQAAERQQQRQSGTATKPSAETMQGLKDSAASRQRGSSQTRSFQGRSGGGSRGGGGRGGGRRR
jgi:hypothetical protein